MSRFVRPVGILAFAWRIALTTGTGCIFGFLVARPAYDAAILAPLFVAMSLSLGLAVFILVAHPTCGPGLGEAVRERLRRLLGVFVVTVTWLTLTFHLTNLYVSEHHAFERFILLDGGIYPWVFWLGQMGAGTVLPLAIVWGAIPALRSRLRLAAGLVVLGGLCQLYVIIIGGQAFPLDMFPGKEIIASSFFDGAIGEYHPSAPEFALGAGGAAFAMLLLCLALKLFPLLPTKDGDPGA